MLRNRPTRRVGPRTVSASSSVIASSSGWAPTGSDARRKMAPVSKGTKKRSGRFHILVLPSECTANLPRMLAFLSIPPMRYRLTNRARPLQDGEPAFAIPVKMLRHRHELAATISFITRRKLFGLSYWGLQPGYFDRIPQDSGVLVRPAVPIAELVPGATFPGDIDLLIVPYEGNELVLDRTIAIEIKIVRASFAKQGKSPNDFGVTQATALQKLGFPYVAIAHLIVSDQSPREAWRPAGLVRIIGPDGLAEQLPDIETDWLPADLMERSFGRMQATAPEPIGLVAAYLGPNDENLFDVAHGTWFPLCRAAQSGAKSNSALLAAVAALVERRQDYFLDNPRYDPA
ncbi:hypothetical protein [Paracoccus versutus]